MRLNKRISSSGFCSRRQAENFIVAGLVMVNGQVVTHLATSVEDKDEVAVDGQKLELVTTPRLWLYYKPVGVITSYVDTHDRPTVFENLPASMPKVVAVGRLDLNSEGLLLLTNSGELARYFELPKNKLRRCYQVRAFGQVDQDKLLTLKRGVEIDGVQYGKIIVELLRSGRGNSWFEVTIFEGKNREIRKIFEYCGLRVNRLIRTEFGPYQLGEMQPGEVKETTVIIA